MLITPGDGQQHSPEFSTPILRSLFDLPIVVIRANTPHPNIVKKQSPVPAAPLFLALVEATVKAGKMLGIA